jgi:hypothetical protein
MVRLSGGPATTAEKAATGIIALALVGFGVYGFHSGAASTVGYLVSVLVVAGIVLLLRREPLPSALVLALAADVAIHLAGGLVTVHGHVLYNTGLGVPSHSWHTRLLQYDHLAHAYGSFLGAMALWVLLAAPSVDPSRRRALAVLCALAGMGVGAVNEIVEFAATLSHNGAHVGGYNNTGWDLVANATGATIAGLILGRSPAPASCTRGPACSRWRRARRYSSSGS